MPLLTKPHFPPTTLRSDFSFEHVLPSLAFALRMIFDLESPSFPKAHSNEEDPPRNPSVPPSGGDSEERVYIPKPKGEFNRPSNGYTLETVCKYVLEWSNDQWSEVELFVETLVQKHLDLSLPRTQQAVDKRCLVHGEVVRKFDFLGQFDKEPGSFDSNWVLNDLIARRLKKKVHVV